MNTMINIYIYASTNLEYIDKFNDNRLNSNIVTYKEFLEKCPFRNLIRVTFEIVTQISTSRELNRVSPNNILEQSTRYCNFNLSKNLNNFGIAAPKWITDLGIEEVEFDDKDNIKNIIIYGVTYNDNERIKEVLKDKYIPFKIYALNSLNSFKSYNKLVKNIKVENARGILPLDTVTRCIYTYTIKEWSEIINKRYYGTTGVPHPNAKVIAKLIRDSINNKYNLNI